MTTLQQIELRCPICDTRFRSQRSVSTNSFGGKRTDFHERAAGTQPLPFLIHMCNRCGYSGAERDFTEEADVSPVLQGARVERARAADLDAAPCRARRSTKRRRRWRSGRGWSRATSPTCCCARPGAAWTKADIEAERFFRRKAAWKFEEALASFDGVAREERAVLTYLVGELWRRVGDTTQATTWFDRVPGEITDAQTQQWVLDAARQQRDCPREWFG